MVDQKLVVSVLKGILTYVPGIGAYIEKRKEKTRHSGSDANFAYSFWFSMLVLLNEKKIDVDFSKIGEVGNGGSLGVAFCALLTGTKEYYSFDIGKLNSKKEQIALLNAIYELFKINAPVVKYHQINIQNTTQVIPENFMKATSLVREVIYKNILSDLENNLVDSKLIKIVPDWENKENSNLSFIFSRAVMEHVNNPNQVYKAIANHLKFGEYMFHDIEFHSHGLTKTSTGHYEIPEILWKIISGKRKFFLNRCKLSDHNTAAQAAGFIIVSSIPNYKSLNNKKEIIGGVLIARKENE